MQPPSNQKSESTVSDSSHTREPEAAPLPNAIHDEAGPRNGKPAALAVSPAEKPPPRFSGSAMVALPAADGHHVPPMHRLRRLLSIEHGDLWVIVGYSAAIGILSLATPVAVQVLVNQLAFAVLLQPVVIMSLLVLIGWGLSGLLRGLQAIVVELLQQRLFVRTAANLAMRLPRTQAAAFEHDHGPEFVNRFLDIVTLQKSAAGLLLDALGIVLQSAMGLLVLAFYHPVLLAFDVTLIGCILFILFALGRRGVSTSIEESRAKYAVVDWLWEVARHPLLHKSEAGLVRVRARANELLCSYLDARRRHFRILFRQIGGALALQALGSAALLGLGGALVIAGQLTVGQLVAAEIIVSSVVAGIAKLGKHLESYYDLMASLDKLGHLEDLPIERAGGAPLELGAQRGAALRLHGISAGYTPFSPLLCDVHLRVEPGERVAVTGAASSGKSLLCDLIYGLRPPACGFIEIDHQDLRSLDLASVRTQVMLLRGAEFTAGSLVDNLRGDLPDATPLEVRAALCRAGLFDELSSSPEGLLSQLIGDAETLSAGQKRRLAVARVLLHKPRLLLIDDCQEFDPAELAPLCDPAAPWTVILFCQTEHPLAKLCQRTYPLAVRARSPQTPAPQGDVPVTPEPVL